MRTCCERVLAMGALIITRCGDGPWQIGLSHQISQVMAQKVITGLALQQAGNTRAYVTTILVGQAQTICISANALLKKAGEPHETETRLVVLLPVTEDMSSHTIGLVEAFALSLGLAIKLKIKALVPHKASPSIVDNCPICGHLQLGSRWVPWAEYVSKRTSIILSHSICPACLNHHYPDLPDCG